MIKLAKYLKPYIFHVFLIVVLLFVQATADLALPDYTSNIVNIGIQQGGIQEYVPGVIRKSQLDKLTVLMSKEDKDKVYGDYTLIQKDKLSSKELAEYEGKYPIIKSEDIYILNKDVDVNNLSSAIGKYMIMVYGIENNDGSNNMAMNIPKGVDPFIFFSYLPQSAKDNITKQLEDKLSVMPSSMTSQGAVPFIKAEYEAIGMNTGSIQSQYILKTGGIMILVALVSMTASVVVGFVSAKLGAGLGRNLRDAVFKKVAGFSNREFDNFSTASLITRSTNDIQQIQSMMSMILRILFYAPILATGGIIHVYRSNASMSWIIAVAIGAILVLVIGLFSLAIPRFKIIQKQVDRLNLVTRQILSGIPVIRGFSTEKLEEANFDKANRDLTSTNLFVSRTMTLMMPLMMLVMNGITLLIIWVGSHQVDSGAMQVGDMMAFIQYAMQIIMSFLFISMLSIILPRATVAAGRIDEILVTEESIMDPVSPIKPSVDGKGLVKFTDVGFSYPGAEDMVLSGINFTANPGETTAFIGSTGSGKSTLINLIPRFYDVTQGSIEIDGIDIRDMTQHDLRNMIGYAPQKGVLFSGTIKSNVAYGMDDVEDKVVEKAIEIAQAQEFVDDKEDGIDSSISQGGTNVSGGQKQRLSIARALAKKSKILIFDDTFSALDFKTDANLRKAIGENIKDKTILIVAQRISTIMQAEKIIVLDKGIVVGEGNHKWLLENCQVYREIASSQLSEEEINNGK